jgi:hypothetical protein
VLNRVETNRSPEIDDSKCQQLFGILLCERLLLWFVRVVVRPVKFERGNDYVICFIFFCFSLWFVVVQSLDLISCVVRACQTTCRTTLLLLSCRVLFCVGEKGNTKREGYIPTTSLYIFTSGNATSDTTRKNLIEATGR